MRDGRRRAFGNEGIEEHAPPEQLAVHLAQRGLVACARPRGAHRFKNVLNNVYRNAGGQLKLWRGMQAHGKIA